VVQRSAGHSTPTREVSVESSEQLLLEGEKKRLKEEVSNLLFIMAFEEVLALRGGFRGFLIEEIDSLSR
jgi:hypothetical protein